MYYKEQNYKEIYFMDLSIYIYIYKFRVSNIFIVNTKNVINNFEIEGGKSGGKLGRCKVRRRLNLSTRIIERNWISNLRPLCSALYHPISLHPPRLIKISNKKHRFSAAALMKVSHPSNWGKEKSEGKGGKKRCCILPSLER